MNQTSVILLALAVAGLGVYMLTKPPAPVVGTPPVSQATDAGFEDKAEDAFLSWVFGPHGSTTA